MVNERRNFHAFLWHATFLSLTTTFTDINTVIPSLIIRAGGSDIHIGILTGIMVGTPIIGQLLFASYLHLRERKKGFLLLGINARVVVLAVVAVILVRASGQQGTGLIAAVLLLMFSFALAGTFAGVSYMDILGKSLIEEQRPLFFVRRQIFMSVAVLVSAPVAHAVLSRFEYPANYSVLFGLAACLLLTASAGFWILAEPRVPVPETGLSVVEVLRSIPQQLRLHPELRKYIAIVNLTGFGLTLMPFYVVFARSHYGLTGRQVGTYLVVQTIGMVLSNVVWSKVVSRFGFRGVIRGCILCGTALPLLALMLAGGPLWLFLVVFFLMGMAMSARRISFDGLFIEITTDANRTLHKGIVGATSLSTALFPLIAGGVIHAVGYAPVFIAVSLIVASAWLAARAIAAH